MKLLGLLDVNGKCEDVLGVGSIKLPIFDDVLDNIATVISNFTKDRHMCPLGVGGCNDPTNLNFLPDAPLHAKNRGFILDRNTATVCQAIVIVAPALLPPRQNRVCSPIGECLGQRTHHPMNVVLLCIILKLGVLEMK